MTRNCDHCGVAYSRPPSQIGRFCSKTCGGVGRRKDEHSVRRIKYAPEHPLAGVSGYVSEARYVLFAKIGPGAHACHWCGALVRWMVGIPGNAPGAVIADHLDGDPLNDAPGNLVASCAGCNGTRHHWISDDESFRVRPDGTRLRGTPRVCESCGNGFVAWQTTPGKGRFCSRSCARRTPNRPTAVES